MNQKNVSIFLSKLIDFNKDLPLNIFRSNDYVFWFFERPLLDYEEILCNLIDANLKYLKESILITFGDLKDDDFMFYYFENMDELKNLENLENSRLEYPIVITNENGDWLAFESSREELGVIGLNINTTNFSEISNRFNNIFINLDDLDKIKKEGGWYSKAATSFFLNYSI